jgi:hypothetical protein
MSTTTVAELKAALGVGSLYSDAVIQSVCDSADNVLLPFLWKNDVPIIAHSSETATTGTLYFNQDIRDIFYIGQSVVIANSGSRYNGTKTITGVGQYSFTIAITSGSINPYHEINPFGTASAETYTDYSAIPAIKQASLMISEAIWQARQAPSGQGMSVDGYTPSPFTMSNTLVARVRGLIAPYLSPNSMVG